MVVVIVIVGIVIVVAALVVTSSSSKYVCAGASATAATTTTTTTTTTAVATAQFTATTTSTTTSTTTISTPTANDIHGEQLCPPSRQTSLFFAGAVRPSQFRWSEGSREGHVVRALAERLWRTAVSCEAQVWPGHSTRPNHGVRPEGPVEGSSLTAICSCIKHVRVPTTKRWQALDEDKSSTVSVGEFMVSGSFLTVLMYGTVWFSSDSGDVILGAVEFQAQACAIGHEHSESRLDHGQGSRTAG